MPQGNAQAVQLYSYPYCIQAQRIIVALNEAEIEFEHNLISPNDLPLFVSFSNLFFSSFLY